MRSYIDNRGVYHRFIDWAKLFGRKKDVEEKVEEVAEIQESVEQYLEDKDTTAPAVDDDCCDDCDGPFDGSYEYLSLDKDDAAFEDEFDGDACEDDCPADDCDGPYDCPDVINEPDNENPCQPENPPVDNIEQLDTVNTSKPEKVVKEKSAAKKTAKKTTTKSSKSKK